MILWILYVVLQIILLGTSIVFWNMTSDLRKTMHKADEHINARIILINTNTEMIWKKIHQMVDLIELDRKNDKEDVYTIERTHMNRIESLESDALKFYQYIASTKQYHTNQETSRKGS